MPDQDTARPKFPKYINSYHDRHGRLRTYYRRQGERQIHIDGEPLSKEWWDEYNAIHANPPGRAALYPIKGDRLPRPIAACQNELMKKFDATRFRAKNKKVEFRLTPEDIEKFARRANGRCELTKLPFQYHKTEQRARPFVPSLDRINPQEGYTSDNCRVVATAVNIALGEWGFDQLLMIANALVVESLSVNPD